MQRLTDEQRRRWATDGFLHLERVFSAEEVLATYCTLVYHRVGSYEGAARVLGLDRRTVKAKIDRDLLERL